MRAVISFPAVMPATTEAARAFLERGMLARYETTIAFAHDDRFTQLLARAPGGLPARLHRELMRRALPGVPSDRIHAAPGWELLRIAAARAGAGDVICDRIWEQMITRFDAGVARRLSRQDELVYGFLHGCDQTFARAAELGIHRVFDMAAPHHSFVEPLLAAAAEAQPELVTPYALAQRKHARERNARAQRELDAAELVIANSSFTARTLTDTGYPKARVKVVWFASPPVDASWQQLEPGNELRVLFAGNLSVHKGAHLALEAFRRLDARRSVRLIAAGRWALSESLRAALPKGVELRGQLPGSELARLYRECDVLLLPSLGDGFGLVVSEAFAHGMPVITTCNVGASDLVQEGRNGFVIPAGDADAIAERIAWCADHRSELRAMRMNAQDTAASNQWHDYRQRLVDTIVGHFDGR